MTDLQTVPVCCNPRLGGVGITALLTLVLLPTIGYADDQADAVEAGEAVMEDAPAKEQAEAKPAPQKPKPAANPLGQIFRGIFGQKPPQQIIPQNKNNPKAPPQQTRPAEEEAATEEEADEKSARDHIDLRAPHDRELAKALRRAERFIESAKATNQAAEWRNAMDTLAHILGSSEAKPQDADSLTTNLPVIRQEDGQWTPAADVANKLLGELPTEYLNLYRATYGGRARQLLDDAIQQGDAAAIGQIAFRYFHTPAGKEALNRVGMYHADRGEFGLAARWFVRLMNSQSTIAQQPRWQLKAAAVLSAAGHPLADELLEKLKESETPLTVGADVAVEPQEIITQILPKRTTSRVQSNWPMLLGNPSRTGIVDGDEPLLLPRWHHPLTNFEQGVESIEMLADDLVDLGRSPVPAFFPLAVDGKILSRTLRGVSVFDAESGADLWETREGLSPERILSGVRITNRASFAVGGGAIRQAMAFPTNSTGYYNGYNADQDKLTSLLFRNGTWGVISSDGQRVYVIEDHAILSKYQPGNTWAFRNGNTDPYHRDFTSNKIAAYDIKSGRLEWEIGGQATDEPFDRRLAGWYFSGVPTPDGNRLLVMGEKENEIWLFALEPETGRPQWSQLLAFADTEISHDFGRRWWNAQPSVKDGVIVCPTTIGWLIGVDQTQHAILWSHRYDPPNTGQHLNRSHRNETYIVPSSPLNGRWTPSAPVISGRHVVFTAPETQKVVCLDLFTGKPNWQRNRDNDLYLAGVFDDQAVFVGKTQMRAQNITTGETVWTLAYTEDAKDETELMRPAGHGVAVDGIYHLPLLSRQLLSVELGTGKIRSRLFLPEDHPALGNLLMHRGLLVSAGPHGITAFEQRDSVRLAIQTRLKANPIDAWALLRQGEIELLHHDHQAAWELLQRLDSTQLSAADQTRWTEATVSAVSHLIRENLEGADTEFAALEELAETHPKHRRLVQQLAAERFRARGDVSSAFHAYLSLADSTHGELVPRNDDRDVRVRLSQWLAGRLAMLWRESSEADRKQLDDLVRVHADKLWQTDDTPKSFDRAEKFLDLFRFHPLANAIRGELATRYADNGQLGNAELHLRRLMQSNDKETSLAAFAQLASRFEQAGLPADAATVRQQQYRRFPESTPADQADQTPTQAFNTPVSWSDQSVSLEMMSSYYSSNEAARVLTSPPYRMPCLQQSRWEFQYQYQQLVQKSLRSGEVEWIVPLKIQNGAPSHSMISSEVVGSMMFLVHGDVVHALSPLEKRILWTHALDLRGSNSSRRSVNRTSIQAMQTGSSFSNSSSVRQRAYGGGMLAVANSEYVCVYGRRSISVLDALTGEVRWVRDRVPSRSVVYGTDEVVLLVPQNSTEIQAYSAFDGRKIDLRNAQAVVNKLVHTTGRHLIVSERRTSASLLGLSGAKASIKAIEPETSKVSWQRTFPESTYFSTTEDGYLAAVQATGDLSMIDMETGFVQKFESFPSEWLQSLTERFLVVDSHQVYLFLNKRSRNHVYFSSQLKQFRMNGRFIVFDRQTGKRKWDSEVSDTVCIVEELPNLPLLMFFSAKYQKKGNFGYYSTKLTVYDKHTGWKVADHDWATNSSGFRSLEVDLKDKRIELVTYNMRIQMQAKPRPPAKAEDVGTGE
ncbi:outer membrane protein assembly factor BamB family protein [Thalassoroseus pseudoceratinae]|uniref:outer membrane protein assembly factor BamB family protein n=1 Tax=Thalassoroseus pseudoceratinae TaxID=2713176 RepID=UPI001420C3B0|nr:PQQ-binding-like beta-propeller repeat protein [Thalassoroseus pseudoceratinae]